MSATKTPFVHVGHKDGKFAGAITHDCSSKDPKKQAAWKKQVAEFCGDFISNGFQITTVFSREEYDALIKDMPVWKWPEPEEPAQGALFAETSL